MKSRDYLEGYNACLMKMQSALYDIQNDLIDLNNRIGVDSKLTEAGYKDDKELALQDVVLYLDRAWRTKRAGMVMSNKEGMLVILTEKETVVAEYPKDVEQIGHIYSIKYPATITDAIKEVKRHYMEANKK